MNFTDIDFELMDHISSDDALANLIVSNADHWRREGFKAGYSRGVSSVKFDMWITVFCVFIISLFVGSYFI